MLKIGLIGAGFMGSMHSACYLALGIDRVRISAVADLIPEKAKETANRSGAEIYKTGFELIEEAKVDIIDICLPTYLHAEHAIKAMEKGRAVFIEKPVCINLTQARQLIDTQKKTNAKVMVGHCLRFWPEYMWLKEAVVNNRYGKMRSVVLSRLSPKPKWSWENWLHRVECSGSVAMDLHIHDVDTARYIVGEPDFVEARASRDDEGVIQQIFGTYKYRDKDVLVEIEGAWDYPSSFPFSMEYRVSFDEATAVFDSNSTPSLVVYPNKGEKFSPEMDTGIGDIGGAGGNISNLGGYYNELKYFTDRIADKAPIEIAALIDGVMTLELLFKELDYVGGSKNK